MKLRWRVAGAVSLLLVVMGVLTVASINRVVMQVSQQQAADRGLAVARAVASGVADSVLQRKYLSTQAIIDGLQQSTPGIRYIYVTTLDGSVLSTFGQGFPVQLLAVNRLPDGVSESTQHIRTSEGPILDVGVVVLPGIPSQVHVGFAEDAVTQMVNQTSLWIILLTLLGVLLGTTGSYFLGSWISRPIEALSRVAEQLGQGELDREIPLTRGDEVGSLCQAFNAMAASLRLKFAQLADSERRYHTILEAADDAGEGVALFRLLGDGDGQLVYANETFAHWYGVDGRAACTTARSLLPEPSDPLVWGRLLPPFADPPGGVAPVAMTMPGEGASPLHLEISARRFVYEAEPAVIWLVRDVTVRHREEVERALLLQQTITAQEEERYRIARELHDETLQSLSATLFGIKVVEASLHQDAPSEQIEESLGQVKGRLTGTIREVQRVIYDLRPILLDELGLVAAIHSLADQRLRAQGIEADVQVVGHSRRLDTHQEVAVFRIVQEALQNIVRHAEAHSAVIAIEFRPDSLFIQVADDGIGFDPSLVPSEPDTGSGLGLLGMRERASLLGGTLSIDSAPGEGTTVVLTVPLPEPMPEVPGASRQCVS